MIHTTRNSTRHFDFQSKEAQCIRIGDLLKKTKAALPSSKQDKPNTKDDFYKAVCEAMAKQPPSELFVAGPVFDLVLKQHESFEKCVRDNDVLKLHSLLTSTYLTFLTNPEIIGIPSSMINVENDDTNINMWNADIFLFEDGTAIAQGFIPVESDKLIGRIVGIIFSEHGNGFYYCMVNKDTPSTVMRNRALYGARKAGEVKGLGIDLMEAFLNCIKQDYASDCVDYVRKSITDFKISDWKPDC